MWHYCGISSGYGAIALTICDQRLQEGIQRMKDTGIRYCLYLRMRRRKD
ncbi:hypothetical protein [Nostoc sp.]